MAQLDKNHLLLRSNFSFLYRTSIADERPYQIQVLTAKKLGNFLTHNCLSQVTVDLQCSVKGDEGSYWPAKW